MPPAQTVESYQKEKEEAEVFTSLRKFDTINEINASFGANSGSNPTPYVSPGHSGAHSPTAGFKIGDHHPSFPSIGTNGTTNTHV
jgi:hypothetical protein